MSDLEVTVGKLEERVDNMEKRHDETAKKVDGINSWLMATFGAVLVACVGVIANLMILLSKK